MCKERPVILVNKVVDPKRIIGKKLRAEEEERHKGSLTKKTNEFLSLGSEKCAPTEKFTNTRTGI
jgi:hypothetical protein